MKKTILLTLTMAGAMLIASAADPAKSKSETPSADPTPLAVTGNAPAGGLDPSDKAYDARVGERLARSGAITAKPEKSIAKDFFKSLNPFAPLKPMPTTPWISRASWNEIATTEHQRTITTVTADTNRELKIKITVWRD